MKKSFLLLFLSFLSISAFGQICKTGNEWNYLKIMIPTCSYDVNCSGAYYEVDRYKVGNDTVINEKTYKTILLSIENLNGRTKFFPFQFLREDVSTKKIYQLYDYYDEYYEILLYDFNLQKDSVFKQVRPYSYFENNVKHTYMNTYYQSKVVETDSVTCNGSKRLRIRFDDYSSLYLSDKYVSENFSWIEGIGSVQDLTNYQNSSTEVLLCFKQDSTMTYLNQLGLDCDYEIIDNIDVPIVDQFTVATSPAQKGTIFINCTSGSTLINQLIVYNLQGAVILRQEPKTSFYVINNLPSGMYIMQINNFVRKFVVK